MFLSGLVRFEIGLSSRRTLVKAITLGQSLALQEIAIVGCNSRRDARRNERSRVKSTPPQRSPGTADANRDYHGRPRRPLRGTSHLDSGAGLAGSTFPLLLRPTFPSARPFRFLPVSIFSRFEMEGKEHVSRDYRQDRGHGGFPEIIRKSSPVVPT